MSLDVSQMTPLELINTFVVIIGLPSIIAAAIFVGRRLQKLDDIDTDIETIKTDTKDFSDRIVRIETKVEGLEKRVETIWKDSYAPTSSPRQLNERGEHILEESGIKNLVHAKKEVLLAAVRKKDPKTPYDAESMIEEVMLEFPEHCPEEIDTLKEGAFKVGEKIEAVLFVGSVYLRDMIFSDLGFELDDLDKEPAKS